MKTIQTLFDTQMVKETKESTPVTKLKRLLQADINDSIYRFKIHYNRVYYDKVTNFPKDITKEIWLETALKVWQAKQVKLKVKPFTMVYVCEQMELLDPLKANQ